MSQSPHGALASRGPVRRLPVGNIFNVPACAGKMNRQDAGVPAGETPALQADVRAALVRLPRRTRDAR